MVSLVLSVLWFAGLGSLAAIVLAVIARRRIKRHEDTLSGKGVALAGLIIGIVGVALTAVLIPVVFVASSFVGILTTPVVAPVGTTLPIDSPFNQDLASVRVASVTYPVEATGTSVVPAPGTGFAVADVFLCADSNGVTDGIDNGDDSFELTLTDGDIVDPGEDVRAPGVDSLRTIAPNACAEGFVTFEVPEGAAIHSISYLGAVRRFEWVLPVTSPPSGT